jgi:hypothetical protein
MTTGSGRLASVPALTHHMDMAAAIGWEVMK